MRLFSEACENLASSQISSQTRLRFELLKVPDFIVSRNAKRVCGIAYQQLFESDDILNLGLISVTVG